MIEEEHNKSYYEKEAQKAVEYEHKKKDLDAKNSETNDTSNIAEHHSSGIDIYSAEVLQKLIDDNLPSTPNNFSLYFDRLLENKSENLRKQITMMLELEENNSNDDENIILLEKSLKQGFSSVKNMLSITASLYKNMSLMTKIMSKRKNEFSNCSDLTEKAGVFFLVETDIEKLNTILKKQSSHMKKVYEDTALIVKNVENETIFDNQFGVYNKRYLLNKINKESESIKKLKHQSSLIFIELSKELTSTIKNNKEIIHMTRIIARLLLKTSRRSDIIAYYGDGMFAMLLRHTDLENAKRTSTRLDDLVSNSNIFIEDREVQLKISMGITNINIELDVDEIVVNAMDGIDKAYKDPHLNYAII